MGESERESETESEKPLISLSYVSLSLSLKWFRNGAFVISFFPQRQRQTQSGEKGQQGGIWEGVGEGEGREKRSKWPVHENESKFQSQTSQGRRKRKERAKLTGAQLFSFSFSSFFFFFSVLERVAKHDFYGIVLQSGSVKSSQVKSDKSRESKECRAERETRGRGRQGLSVRVSVRMFLCVRVSVNVCTKLDLGREEDMLLCVCVCVYVQRGPSPHSPSKRRLLRTKLLSTLFFKIVNVYSYFLVFCVLPFSFFLFHVSLVGVVSVVHL